MLEAYTLLGGLAARTSRIRLGTMVTGVTYRNPALLAKIVTTLDVIGAGRAMLGIGAAWYDVEHEGLGVEFPPVGNGWTGSRKRCRSAGPCSATTSSTFKGRYYSVHEARNLPRPVQPGGSAHPDRGRRGEAHVAVGGPLRRLLQHLRGRRHRHPQDRRAARAL